MRNVIIAEDVLDPESWKVFEDVGPVGTFLATQFAKFPASARIYLDHVAQDCEVTPYSEADTLKLEAMEGLFYVMVYPEEPLTIALVIAVVLSAVSIGLSFLLRPNTSKNADQSSPNNSLGDRQNTARPNERIPDIFGTVRSTPDLLQSPYRTFEDSQEVETSFMCIGRGAYDFHQTVVDDSGNPLVKAVWDIKDDLTPIQEEGGASVEIFAPFTAPQATGATPQLRIGQPINQPVWTVQPSSAVLGQILRPSNTQSLTGNNSISCASDGTINANGFDSDGNTIDFTVYFQAGDFIDFVYTGAEDPGGVQADLDLSGSYEALTVTSTQIVLANPYAANSAWTSLAAFTGGTTKRQSPTLTFEGDRSVGPFILNYPNMTEVWCNFVAPNGLFKVSGSSGTQFEIDIDITVFVQAIDGQNLPIGDEIPYFVTLRGSSVLQNQRGITAKCVLQLPGSCQVRVLRTSTTDDTWVGQNVDQVQWRDMYAITAPTVSDYGNVTTVMTKTFATASALAAKSRKFNLLVTRKLPVRNMSTFAPTGDLAGTVNAADIICAMAEDPFIGNRSAAEINYANIYALAGTSGSIASYFGTTLVVEFGYTFDDSNVSFEESFSDVCQAIFCQAYRRGSVLNISFEKPASVGSILFNHRNKIPGSENRTVMFGFNNDFDGIELDYIDPNAPNFPDIDTTVTLYFPTNQSARSAKKVTLIGVRNNVQAALIGWRLYQKLLYQNTVAEFKTLKEANDLVLQDPILVADNTRDDVIDGQVLAVNGLELKLSQPCSIAGAFSSTIFLQLPDGTIEGIACTQGSAPDLVILASPPSTALNTDLSTWAQTTYMMSVVFAHLEGTPNGNHRPSLMLLSQKDPEDKQQYTLKSVNYDDRYYSHDQDYATGVLALNGSSYNGNGGYTYVP